MRCIEKPLLLVIKLIGDLLHYQLHRFWVSNAEMFALTNWEKNRGDGDLENQGND